MPYLSSTEAQQYFQLCNVDSLVSSSCSLLSQQFFFSQLCWHIQCAYVWWWCHCL